MNSEDIKPQQAVEKALPQITALVEEIVHRMQKGGRLFYIGAGTSGRLGVLDASEVPPTFGVPEGLVIGIIAGGEQALRHPVESAEDDPTKGWNTLMEFHLTPTDSVVGLAASGTTPYVIGAIAEARKMGLLTGCITCNPGSPLALACQYPIEAFAGPEFVTGSTRLKSGTVQKMILNMITTTTMIKLGRVKGNRMVHMQLTNKKLIDRGTRMLQEELKLSREEAKRVLLLYGSVKGALEALSNQK